MREGQTSVLEEQKVQKCKAQSSNKDNTYDADDYKASFTQKIPDVLVKGRGNQSQDKESKNEESKQQMHEPFFRGVKPFFEVIYKKNLLELKGCPVTEVNI